MSQNEFKNDVQYQQIEQTPICPQNISVLFVDAEQSQSGNVSNLLRCFNYQVTQINQNQDVINKLQEMYDMFDLVLMDMGGVQIGIQLLKNIQNNPVLNEIPVVVISGNDAPHVMHECLKIGAADFFVKPVTRKEIQFIWKYVVKSKKKFQKQFFNSENLIGVKRGRESDNLNSKIQDQLIQQENVQIIEKYLKINQKNLEEKVPIFQSFQIKEEMTLEKFLSENSQKSEFNLGQKIFVFINIIKTVETQLDEGLFLIPSNFLISNEKIKFDQNYEGGKEKFFLPPWEIQGIKKSSYFLGYTFFQIIFNDDNSLSNENWKQVVQNVTEGKIDHIFQSSLQLQKIGQFIFNLIKFSQQPTFNFSQLINNFFKEVTELQKNFNNENMQQEDFTQLLYFMNTIKENLQQKINVTNSELNQIDSGLKCIDEFFHNQFSEPNQKQQKIDKDQQQYQQQQQQQETIIFNPSNEAIQEAQRRFSNVSNFHQIKSQFLNVENNKNQTNEKIEKFSKELFEFSKFGNLKIRSETRKLDISRPDSLPCGIGFDCRDEFFAVASTDKTVKIYDYSTFENSNISMHYPIDELESRSKLSCVCWSPYLQSHIALSDHEGIISMWDVNRHKLIQLFEQHTKRVWSVDFCKNSPMILASASDDGTVQIWNMFHSESVQNVEINSQVCSVQFDPQNSNIIAVGCTNNRAYRYDLRKLQPGPLSTIKGHDRTVSYVRYINSNQLVTSSTDSTAKLWDFSKNSVDLMHCYNEHVNVRNFVGCATLPSGLIAVGSENSSVFVYSSSFSNQLASYKFQYKDIKQAQKQQPFISCLAWNQQKGTLLLGSSVGALHLMELV